jgi:hypothetical protein
VVYDWDSLVLERELILVGIAAATFTATWYLPVRVAPTMDEARHFVSDYEAARGAAFSVEDRQQIDAAATYALAYSARCEHALDPTGERGSRDFREALVAASRSGFLAV